MARFIEYGKNPWRQAYYLLGTSVVVPVVACFLFIRGDVSIFGFMAIIAAGVVGLTALNGGIDGRPRISDEVVAGKALRPASSQRSTVREFREDASFRYQMLAMTLVMLLYLPYVFMGGFSGRPRHSGVWSIAITALSALFFAGLLAVCWSRAVRLRIEGDLVRTVHPYLGRWWDRTFRLGEIDSVELRHGRVGREVVIRLIQGGSVRYVSTDETAVDELLGVLRQGIAEAKPLPDDLA